MIKGVEIVPLKQILDDRGKVMQMMRNDSLYFEKFGEIYFSVVHPGKFKGWHKHTNKTLNYACIFGKVELSIFDGKEIMKVYLSPEDYKMVIIKPNLWDGIRGLGQTDSIVANCATEPYSEEGIVRKDNL